MCHAAEPVLGAPMPLVTADDLHRPAVTQPARPVWQMVSERIQSDTRPMPPPPFPRLDPAELGALQVWFTGGAQPSEESCSAPPDERPAAPAASPSLPCQPTEVYTAHAAGDATQGFAISGDGGSAADTTVCFTFLRPASADPQAIAWAGKLDNRRFIHHMNLYATSVAVEDGGVGPCQLLDATYLMGWEPGRPETVLPERSGSSYPPAKRAA
jgi:hypothetical protein